MNVHFIILFSNFATREKNFSCIFVQLAKLINVHRFEISSRIYYVRVYVCAVLNTLINQHRGEEYIHRVASRGFAINNVT